MINIKFLDLFAGIGGFRSGLEMAGNECVGFVEIDKFARQSYQAIYDTEGEWTAHDIRTVRASELPRADIWTFGFPCQDISVAGKQKGFAGKRSSLFFTVTGLIRDLEEKNRPSILLIENVKNLLSINGGWDFLKLQIELDEIGYDVEWDVLDTAEVLPQHRERVYIVGHFRGRSTRKVFPVIRSSREIDNGSNTVNTITTRYGDAQGAGSYISESKSPKIGVKQVGNIVDTGNFNNPQRGRVYDPNGQSPALNCMRGGGLEPKIVVNPHRFNKGGVKSISPTVTAGSYKDNTFVTEKMRIRKLTPLECWRLQGFTDEQFHKAEKVNSNSQLYKQAGNSVTVPVIKAIADRMGYNDNRQKTSTQSCVSRK